jgi:hypothetical protein
VIQHIVLVKWKPDTTEEDIVEVFKASRVLLDDIDAVEKLTIGRNRAEADHGFTHALIVNLADGDALHSYLDHPSRVRFLQERLHPLQEKHIEIDVPADMTLRRDTTLRTWDWGAGASVGMGPPLDE